MSDRDLKIEGRRPGCLHCSLLMLIATRQQAGEMMQTADIIDALAKALADVTLIATPADKLLDDRAAAERAASVVALVKHHVELRQSREMRERKAAGDLEDEPVAGRA